MSDVANVQLRLNDREASVRYQACEELRVLSSLPKEAIEGLRLATSDPDPDVALAARRALFLHGIPAHATSNMTWTKPFLIYGGLAALPIPFLGWLWLSLAVVAAVRLGRPRALRGIAAFLVTAFSGRVLLGLIIAALSG